MYQGMLSLWHAGGKTIPPSELSLLATTRFLQVFKLLTAFGDAAPLLRKPPLTGVYRNFTRLVKFPNANPALKNFSALIFHGLPKNRGEIFGGIATSVNPICYTQ